MAYSRPFLLENEYFFWCLQLNLVICDTEFSSNYFGTYSFWYTDLQTHVLFFCTIFVGKNCTTSCFTFFLDFSITFDSDTLKKPTVPHLKDFFKIIKFVFIKNVSFCIISMLKSGKYGELQKKLSDPSWILGWIYQKSTYVWRSVYKKL